jgi:DNA-binding SARP family transcriptional activator/DNA-binding XRE family transcriptional regulator
MPGDGVPAPSRILREHRRRAGLTQQGLARRAGVSIGVIRDLEQGVSARLQPKSVQRLAVALGLAPRDLVPSPAALADGAPAGRLAGPVDGTPAVAGHDLQIRVLGPLRAWRYGKPVPLGPPMQQAVLGLLALEPGTMVRRELISDALWGPHPPPTSTAMIQTYVSRLRAALGLGRAGIPMRYGSGYQLAAGTAQVDVSIFSRLTAQARAALDSGQSVKAGILYEQALSLWQGEPLAGLEMLRDHPAVTSLHSRWAATIMQYAVVAGLLESHDQALPYLRQLTARDPLNERACASLMIALAACGQQGAAFRAYEQIRHRLGDEYGVSPGPELAAAHLRILRNLIPTAPLVPAARGWDHPAPGTPGYLSRAR